MASATPQVNMETPISVRVSMQSTTRKFKIPLGDLNAQVLPGRLRVLLGIPENEPAIFERFSDSAASFVVLDPNNHHVYKTLFRAAKAKLKLRLRVTFPNAANPESSIPPFKPIGLPGTFSSAFPELDGLGSDTTLNSIKTEPNTSGTAGSAESLIPIANGSAEPSTADAPAQPAPKRISTRLSREAFFAELANLSRQRELALRVKEPVVPATNNCSWSVFCNACDKPMADAHYHCNICDDGDYDLCEACVKSGIHCPDENHWLVKRFVRNGQVVSSTTERLSPKQPKQAELPEMPGAYTEHVEEEEEEEEEKEKAKPEPEAEPEAEAEEPVHEATRTCNCCIKEDQENRFVTCLDCPDYDLCIPCHEANNHGHHPAHQFKAVGEGVSLSPVAEFLCAPGRNIKHAALCDGCDKPIFGVRHKCLNCPDWDFCSECMKNASYIHPGHRFAPLYEPIPTPRYHKVRHVGIYCDGPLCENKSVYIEGTRFKCAICHDTDFCASCEAHPSNKHNHTHPLIQFKTPVRNATITTVHEDQYGRSLAPKGDRPEPRAEPSKAPANAATQVQTIIDVKPADTPEHRPSKEKIEIKDLLAEPIEEKIKVQDLLSSPLEEKARPVDVNKLNAVFVRETVPDGTLIGANSVFTQVWTLRNSGQAAWPAGCSVRYTGGDNMLENVATESNVLDRPVEVGEESAFRVVLKAPQTPGTKISYWRLKTPDGQAFGHRLWCHVTVGLPSQQEPSSLPQVVSPPQLVQPRPGEWHDTFLQQALQHRFLRAQALERQRVEEEKIKAEHEAKQIADARAKAHRAEMLQKLSTEIRAVEIQHRARTAAAKAAIDAAQAARAPVSPPQSQPASELPAPLSPPAQAGPSATTAQGFVRSVQDHQLQLMLQEQQIRKRMLMNRDAEMKAKVAATRQAQEQLLLQQKMRRLELENKARNETKMSPPAQDSFNQMAMLELENNRRLLNARAVAEKAPSPVEVVAEVRPVSVEAVEEEETKGKDKNAMIFPKLDKESPVSSVHDVSSPVSKTESAPLPQPPKSDKSDLEIFEDAESVSLVETSDEDGFMTDEEYDILDASDEESPA
ncbi:uncharacterized protein PV09_01505 [Verruconis gallopava]|uniref:ZZ-type domain-containing protein n=1 Tax=Verruconis gallopava TaxID=253628 RepID=A0A0D1XXR6_9PEZI|nr:uncharacterized protein PV09_01505 [Verruconis gallopava]KIW07546.1 hypothetical protein PV09_01505 [Verruconis gallopava]